jgi:molybdate transport system substrate-binding protein
MGSAPSQAADIRVFSGGAPQGTLEALAPQFEARTGHRIRFTFAHVSIIQAKLAAGDQTDVLLLPASLMAATAKVIDLRSDGRSVLARVGVGVVAREGSEPPAIVTADDVRRMLLAATAIAVPRPGGLTGDHLMRMMTQLGIEDQVRPKLRHKPAIDGGAELIAEGDADVGLYLASEVRAVKGTTLVGLLPDALQNYVVYEIAIPAHCAVLEPALQFVRFVSDPENRSAWKDSGFELVEAGR